ncbi:hypothetical protein N7490_003047 [Penicillium lividum]|nr:hypothetical protein N7490_003047 [Penicillium lividum]
MPSDLAIRAQVVTLKAHTSMNTQEIASRTGLTPQSVNRIYARAIDRGFDPNTFPALVELRFVEDAPRTGRPRKQEIAKDTILSKVRLDRYGREKTCADLAGELSEIGLEISATTIWRTLRRAGFRKTKPTRKPGLTKKMRLARLNWALAHQHWTLEDWKNVIFSDETSVILLHRRGGYRIWRMKDEAFTRSCIRERWKGSSEFMFWACFSYDSKGPLHCWIPETAAEKKKSLEEIEKLNVTLEPTKKEEWELRSSLSRLNLRRKPPGKAPS